MNRYSNHTWDQLLEAESFTEDSYYKNQFESDLAWFDGNMSLVRRAEKTLDYLAELWNELQDEIDYRLQANETTEADLHSWLIDPNWIEAIAE